MPWDPLFAMQSGQGHRASARRHQLSVAATAMAATGSGSSWITDTLLAAAAPPMPIHSAGAAKAPAAQAAALTDQALSQIDASS